MIKSFFSALVIAIVAAMLFGVLVGFVANLPGILIIPIGDWQAEISLALFFAGLSIFIAGLLFVIYFIKKIF